MIATFIFSNKSTGILSKLSNKEFKHVNLSLYDGKHHYQISYTKYGIELKLLKHRPKKAFDIYKRQHSTTAVISIDLNQPVINKWRPLLIQSCNELSRKFSKINLPFSLSPRGLYNKLLKYDKNRGYTILAHWRRKNGD